MVREPRTLESRPDFGDISNAPMVDYPRNARPLWSFPARSEARIPSIHALTSGLCRILRGLRPLETHPHFEAPSHAPRAEYPQFVPSLWSYFACSEVRAPSICTPTLKLCRTCRAPRPLNLYSHFKAISHAPRVACPQHALTLKLFRMLRGSHTLNSYSHFAAISHAPRVAREDLALNPRRS